ncbi:MAG TPA: hypothetical protein VG167_12380 [Verrucomicrobiae bacterium]|nr:hypothetical protein [Verrucomicrobiae bacterium]
MKPIFALALLLGLTASGLAAGTDAIIKQHAKDLANQNNNRYNYLNPQAPAAAPTVPGAPAPPTLAPSLMKFQSELGALHAGEPASAEQQQQLTQDLHAGAQGAKPSSATVSNLVSNLSEVFAQKPLPAAIRARFVQELDAVLNPGKYPQARLEGIFTSMGTMLRDNGATDGKANQIVEAVKTISTQIQQGGAR